MVDGEGLSAKATLNVKVNDVNEAPTCSESVVTLNKTLLVTEDKVVTRLTCTDPDYEKSYKITKYKLDGQDKGKTMGNFNCTELINTNLLCVKQKIVNYFNE